MSHNEISGEMRACIDNCNSCHAICVEMISHCLSIGGDHADPQHIKLLQDCAQICMTSADFMLRTSEFHPQTCAVCADICIACAESCESLAEGGDLMQVCADMCRRCAESCRSMASHSSATASA